MRDDELSSMTMVSTANEHARSLDYDKVMNAFNDAKFWIYYFSDIMLNVLVNCK